MSDETDDLDARIIARAAHLLAPPPPTPEQRLAAMEADLARERAAWLDEMRRDNDALAEVCRERDRLRARVLELEARVREMEARLPTPEQVRHALEQAARDLEALAKRTGTKFTGDLP